MGVRFTAAITHEGECVALALEVEVTSQDHTIDGALANLREALELYFRGRGSAGGHRTSDHRHRPALCVSPALPAVSGADVVAALAKVGDVPVSQRGSHMKLRRR